MASNFKQSNAAVNAATDAVCALANSGYIRFYDGSQPATADTAITTQVLLAEMRFGATAFAAAVAGEATANAITPDSSANATGTVSWFRTLKSDGTSSLWDGNVGLAASSPDCIVNSTAIQAGAEVTIDSMVFRLPKSA